MNQAETLFNINKALFKENKGLKTIAITSGKGGVGKTNVVVNLGIALSKNNIKVAILDADYGLGNIDILLGLSPEYDISDMLNNNIDLEKILISKNGLKIIPASSGIQSLSNLSEEQEERLHFELNKLRDMVDILIIDTAAGISDNVISLLLSSDEVFLVVNTEPTSIVDAYAVIKVVNEIDPFKNFSVITNMVSGKKDSEELFLKLSKAVKKFLNKDINYFGYITYDKNVVESVRFQTPVILKYPDSRSSKNYRELGKKMIDKIKKG